MKHLVSAEDLSTKEIVGILDSATELRSLQGENLKKVPALRGRTVVNLFFENSTRTRISFEIAAKRLSADVINFSSAESSSSKGESLRDTAQTLEALGADAVVLRHPASGAATTLARSGWINASVINAGDGSYQHPTQALLDALTMRDGLGIGRGQDLAGVSVLIVGDLLHSRVARSNFGVLAKLGVNLLAAGPASLVPQEFEEMGATVLHNFDEALSMMPQVLMMLRVQKERMSPRFHLSEDQYRREWSLDKFRLSRLKQSTLLLHPGPMNRGLEISSEAADSHHSQVLRQVENGVVVRMAVLRACLNGEPDA